MLHRHIPVECCAIDELNFRKISAPTYHVVLLHSSLMLLSIVSIVSSPLVRYDMRSVNQSERWWVFKGPNLKAVIEVCKYAPFFILRLLAMSAHFSSPYDHSKRYISQNTNQQIQILLRRASISQLSSKTTMVLRGHLPRGDIAPKSCRVLGRKMKLQFMFSMKDGRLRNTFSVKEMSWFQWVNELRILLMPWTLEMALLTLLFSNFSYSKWNISKVSWQKMKETAI